MNVYTDYDFEPIANVFEGDDYHLPDSETFDPSYMGRVKKIRRRYRNYFDYQDAVDLYNDYMKNLVQRYGGKKRFQIQYLIGNVHEYIPNFPECRKNKRNKWIKKNRLSREDLEPKTPDLSCLDMTPIPREHCNVKIAINNNSDVPDELPRSRDVTDSMVSRITSELDIIDQYYHEQRLKIEKMKGSRKKKERLKSVLNRKALRMSGYYRCLTDRIAEYDKAKKDKFFGIEHASGDMVQYKGTMFTMAEADEHATLDKLKECGVVFSHLSKRQMKIIRPADDKKSMKKKRKKLEKKYKKNRKDEEKFMLDLSNGEYGDFNSFANEMGELTGSRRWD